MGFEKHELEESVSLSLLCIMPKCHKRNNRQENDPRTLQKKQTGRDPRHPKEFGGMHRGLEKGSLATRWIGEKQSRAT